MRDTIKMLLEMQIDHPGMILTVRPSTCTSTIHLTLESYGISPGDDEIHTGKTFLLERDEAIALADHLYQLAQPSRK